MNNLSQTLSFIKPLDGWLSSHEGFLLYMLAKDTKKGEIVEIGSWMGKSTICLAKGSQEGSKAIVTAIDPHLGEYSWGKGIGKKAPTFKTFLHNLETAKVKKYVHPLVTTSEKVAKNWNKKISLLFIDGLHDYKHTNQDFSLWSRFVNEDGVVAFHDAFCGHRGPEKVVLEKVLPSDDYQDIGVVGSIIYIKIGKTKSLLQQINKLRHQILLPLSGKLQTSLLVRPIKFFIIHRIIKTLLVNKYTFSLLKERI